MDETVETGWDVLTQAHVVLRATVGGVRAECWNVATPCSEWTAAQVLQHAVGDQLGYAAALTGEGWPSEDPFTPSGVLQDLPMGMVEGALRASGLAWKAVSHDAEEAPTPLPQGALPPWIAVGACALDAAVHAWDIAVATGQRSPLTADLAGSLLPVAEAIVEPLRAYGVYAPALDPMESDDECARLLRYLGRRPDWTPPSA
jgi:uncharacterized protein (TIGR03086 family)